MKNFFLINSLGNSRAKKLTVRFREHTPIASLHFLKGISNRTKNKNKFLLRKDKIV
jgi:hypothetical protein